MSNKDENQLNDYIDDSTSQPAPDLQTVQVVSQLRQQAEQVEPRPQFVQELSSRLQAEVRQSKSPRSFADWLVLRGVPRLVGATAVVGLIVLLAWGLPKLWQTWANPELEPVVSGDAVSVPERVTAGSTEVFPEVPAQLPLYQIEFDPIPTTPEEAVAWAADFGIPDPQAFTDPRQLGMIQVVGSNDESLIFQPFQPGGISYSARQEWPSSLQTNPSTTEPLPFAEASDIAVNFLAAHDLLPAEYQVFDDEADGFESQDSLRSVSIGPYLADGYTFSGMGGGSPSAVILIAADGQVLFAFLSFANVTPGEMVDIMPAQEAYEAYQAGELRPFGTETTMNDQSTPSFQTFSPLPPEYQVGDEVEVSGWPNVLVAANGDEVRATLNVYPPGTYHLRGDKVNELAHIEAATGDVVVRGVVTAVLAPNEWELTVTDWEVSHPTHNSLPPFGCLKGTFSRETDGDWLTADEGLRYRLPDAPAELNEGDRIEVCTEMAPIADTDITWLNITQPPASEAGMAEGGTSVTAVEVSREVVPGPVPTATMPEATSTAVMDSAQTGMVTVERSVTAVGGTGGGGGFAGPIEAAAPYELGESVSLTGTVDAYILEEEDGEQRYQVTLQSLDEQGFITATLPLSATAAVLQEVADEYYGRFLHVTGEIVPSAEWPGQAVAVKTFTAVWPEASLQNYLGHIELETMDGVDTAVFVDHATDQRYLIAWKTVYYTENEPALTYQQILVSGIINPGKNVSGLPVLILRSTRYDDYIAQVTDVSEFPLEDKPQVFPYGPTYDPMASAEEMVLEFMELSYYFEPTYDSAVPASPGSQPSLAEIQIARPMWVIHGRSPDGLTTYKIYVEATGK